MRKTSVQELFNIQSTLIDLPKFLVNFRKSNKITQKELANELGLSAGAVSEDERERYKSAGRDRLLEVINAFIRICHKRNIT